MASTAFAPLTAALAEHLSWRETYGVLAVILALVTIHGESDGRLCTDDCVGMPQEPGADTSPEAQRTPVELGDLAALRALAHPGRQRAVPGDRRFPPRSRRSPEVRHVVDALDHPAYAAGVRSRRGTVRAGLRRQHRRGRSLMMLRYALKTVRARKAGFLGAFLALMCAAALITACGTLLETGLRGTIRTERYAAAPVVVSADQNVHQTTVKRKKGKTKVKHKAKPVAERAWLPAGIGRTLAGTPGVARVIPELTFMAEPLTANGTGGRTAHGHAWESAALTPYRLTAGTAPTAATDVVVDRHLAERARLEPGDRLTVQSTKAPRSYRVSGIAAPATAVRHQTSLSA
ncbi:hypothetical protein QFZ66_004184 [Streptomyces sp. B4I13]|nr:hypothetical protein [Streptomyces sp. B4I13]